ncbi:MAG: exopolyphosphatase, partial [Pseudomonadota bacterium]
AGCVVATQRHFADGKVDADAWQRAITDVLIELHPLQSALRDVSWHSAIGCSGSIKAIATFIKRHDPNMANLITVEALCDLRDELLLAGDLADPRFDILSDSRRKVFAGGVAVLYALYSALDIRSMRVSMAALREGVLYELYGRSDEDVQRQTVASLQQRFGIDTEQADRVSATVAALLTRVKATWLFPTRLERAAQHAAQLHEIGLAISHSQYHKHGEMLISHADLPGFSRRQQLHIATLVRIQRKRFSPKLVPPLLAHDMEPLLRIAMLLRISVILCRDRHSPQLEKLDVRADRHALALTVPSDWLAANPLTQDELNREVIASQAAGIALTLHTA